MKRFRLAAGQREIILRDAEKSGRLAACRLLAVEAVADGDEGGIGVELELDRAACTLGRILLCHRVTFRCVAGEVARRLEEWIRISATSPFH